jgi:predicted nucleotidyltransferase
MDRKDKNKQTMDKKNALKIAIKYLSFLKSERNNIVKAYLFGSYAKGNYNDSSDIDIAIVFNNIKNKNFETQIQLLMLTTKFDTRIEPHPFDKTDFNNNNNPLVNEVLKTGIEIKL